MELSEKFEQSPVQKQSEPKINFLHINHSDENFEKIWQSAKNNDIILLETVDLSQATREDDERVINSVSSKKSALVRRQILGDLYNSTDFISQTIRRVILEGKEFHYIDILSDDESHKFIDDKKNYQKLASNNFFEGNFDISFQLFKLAVVSKAQSHNARENLVSEQISNLVSKHATEWKDKQIGVIQGMSHSRTYKIFKRDNPAIKTSRSFLREDRFVFPLQIEAKKRLLNGSVEDRELAIKKEFIHEFLIFPYVYSTDTKDFDYENTEKIARSLNRDEVESIFNHLSTIQNFAEKLTTPARQVYVGKHLDTFAHHIIESHPLESLQPQTLN